MHKVKLQFHAGLYSIGGTVISVECDQHRFVFDIGRVFNPSLPVFHDDLQPRSIHDLKRLHCLTDLPGLYEGDGTEAPSGMKTMVAVSHSHLDHVGQLPYLRRDIPVLLSRDTHKLLQALDRVLDGPGVPLAYHPVEPMEVVQFGPIQIQVVPVDHDTPGACAFFITTPEMKIVYSGDLRVHGSSPDTTHRFSQLARDFAPDVLLIEGTRALSETNDDIIPEPEVESRLTDTIKAAHHGVYFTFYPRHPERLGAFLEAARNCNRQLVVDAPSAYIYEVFGGDVSGLQVFGGYEKEWTEQARDWVKERNLPVVSAEQIRGREDQYILEMLYHHLVDWVDIDVEAGGLFIHSNGTPLGPFDPRWNNLMHWLKTFGLEFAFLGSTGHAARGDIISIIETINPKVLMPIHSMQPERIGLVTTKRIMPEYGKVYTMADFLAAEYPEADEIVPPTDVE